MDKLQDMKEKLAKFLKERDWQKFHNPKDLAIALSIEANELLEHFQWKKIDELPKVVEEKRDEIASEVADIMHFLIAFSNITGIDLYEEFLKKLEHNNKRYPKDLVKGKSHKYTYYQKKD
jgi:NTP pyrophosphatase (non-canonical NTP hydrolase)